MGKSQFTLFHKVVLKNSMYVTCIDGVVKTMILHRRAACGEARVEPIHFILATNGKTAAGELRA